MQRNQPHVSGIGIIGYVFSGTGEIACGELTQKKNHVNARSINADISGLFFFIKTGRHKAFTDIKVIDNLYSYPILMRALITNNYIIETGILNCRITVSVQLMK